MAKLNGVVSVDAGVIQYGCFRYERVVSAPAAGDIVKIGAGDWHYVTEGAYYYVVEANDFFTAGLFNAIIDDDGDEVYAVRTDSTRIVYRKSAGATPLTTAQLIEIKRAELAELEAQVAEESTLKVGDYARFISGDDDLFASGDIVKVTCISTDKLRDYPVDTVSAVNGYTESSFRVGDLRKITPAEARAALIAQVDALFTSVSV